MDAGKPSELIDQRSSEAAAPPKRYTVAALFAPLAVGTSFPRRSWPGHVTLASNFVTDATVDELVCAVRAARVLGEPLVVQLAGTALFGPNHDVPVRLVQPTRVSALHDRLAGELEPLPGFVADEPSYWRSGYHPHLTLGPTISAREGDRRSVCCLVIPQLIEGDATIAAALGVPTQAGDVSLAR